MNTYDVIRKVDRVNVYSYSSDVPIAWNGMGFDLFDHIPQSIACALAPPCITKFNGKRHLTKLEFRSLLMPEEQQGIDEFEAHFESMAFPDDVKRRIRTGLCKRTDATFIDLDDEDTAGGLGLYVALGKLVYTRISEILNG